jgi:hypothetical protein
MLQQLPAWVLISFAAGCDTHPDFGRAGPDGTRLGFAEGSAPVPGPWTIDDEFAAIAQEASGFAGFYLDSDGRPVILVTDASQAIRAKSVLQQPDGSGVPRRNHTGCTV